MTYKLNAFQKKWLKALESGEYAQDDGALCMGRGFCCLGVACEVAGLEAEFNDASAKWSYEGDESYAPPIIVGRLRLRDRHGTINGGLEYAGDNHHSLANLNDAGMPFAEIASFIRANPEKVFLP